MREKVQHKGLALAILAAAQFMVILDATIVNVALPAIQKALGFTTDSQLQWVVTAYALIFGGFLLLGGRLADLMGRRKLFLIGVTIFAAASLMGGLAQTSGQLIAFRGLQGLGGALLAPAALSLVLTIFKEGAERNKALGIWSMVSGGGGAVGLVLGGLLTQYIDWRWTFFINVPIGLGVLYMARKHVPEGAPATKERVDVAGAIAVTASLSSLVYALAKAADLGWGASQTVSMFIVSAVLMAVFIVNELMVKHPLIKLGIFKRRNVTGGNILQLLTPAAMFGMFFYLSIYMQHILHYSPTMTGVANLPFTMVIIVIAGVLSKQISKFNPKLFLVGGPILAAIGLFWFARIPVAASYWTDILPGIMLMASGMAMVFVTNTMVATSGVSHQDSGLVSGLLNTGQQIGGAIGLAVLTVVSTAATKTFMVDNHGNPALLTEGLVHGFRQGFVAAAFFAIAAALVALFVMKTHKPTKSDLANQAENDAEALAAVPGV